MVRSSPTLIARPAWYDRNPLVVWRQYSGALVAPHSSTERWTYTVPAGKKAYLEVAFAYTTRRTTATTAAQLTIIVSFTPSGGTTAAIMELSHWDNTLYISRTQNLAMSIVMLVGDTLNATTSDASTGGTNDFIITAKLTEFDA